MSPVTDLTSLRLLFRRNRRPTPAAPADKDVVLGFREQGEPVLWLPPSQQAASHALCLASSGTGKSVMLANAIAAEFAQQMNNSALADRMSCLVIDPKGDFSLHLIQALASRDSKLLSQVNYLDPFADAEGVVPFAFNLNKLALGKTPLDVRALQISNLCAAVSTGVSEMKHLGVGARQVDTLLHVVLGALANKHPEANILWALDALVIRQGLKRLAGLTTSKRAKQYLSNTFLSPELQASCASRLRTAFSLTSSLEQIVTANGSLQFADLLSPGQITILNLGMPTGGITELSKFYASLFVQLCYEHLMERPSPYQGHHVRLVIDEVQVVAEVLEKIAEAILTLGRSKNVSLTAISQGSALITSSSEVLLPVMLSNTNFKLIGRLNAEDAEILAKTIAPGEGVDETLNETRSTFIARVTNLKDREFVLLQPGQRERFTSAEVKMEGWREAQAEHAQDIAAMKARLTLPPSRKPRVALDDVAPYKARGASQSPPPPKNSNHRGPKAPRSPWG